MRDMTTAELATFYGLGRCPFCEGVSFLNGPRGGLMQNIQCCSCAARINIVPGPVMGLPPPHIGQVLKEPDQRPLEGGA